MRISGREHGHVECCILSQMTCQLTMLDLSVHDRKCCLCPADPVLLNSVHVSNQVYITPFKKTDHHSHTVKSVKSPKPSRQSVLQCVMMATMDKAKHHQALLINLELQPVFCEAHLATYSRQLLAMGYKLHCSCPRDSPTGHPRHTVAT